VDVTVRVLGHPKRRQITRSSDEKARASAVRTHRTDVVSLPIATKVGELLGENLTALARVHAGALVVLFPCTDTDSQRESPARKSVDRGCLLRKNDGVPQRADDHHRYETYAIRDCGRGGESRHRLVAVVENAVDDT
jgi:hypothetical protein